MELTHCQYCTTEIVVKKAVTDKKYAECNACGEPSHLDCLLQHRMCKSCQSGEARFSPKEITDVVLLDPLEQFVTSYEAKRRNNKYQDLPSDTLVQIVCHELQIPQEKKHDAVASLLDGLPYPPSPLPSIYRGAAVGGFLGTVAGVGIGVLSILFGIGDFGFHAALYATTGYTAYLGANNRYNAWKKKLKTYVHQRQKILTSAKTGDVIRRKK